MKFDWVKCKTLAMVAFLMGLPLVEQANADSGTDIAGSALSLVGAIIDAAGNS